MKNPTKTEKSASHDGIPENGNQLLYEELPDEVSGKMSRLMQEYLIPSPDETRIDQTVNTLMQIMKSGEARKRPFTVLMRMLYMVSHVMQYSGKWYVAFCLILYAAALEIAMNDNSISSYVITMILGPVPFLLAVIGVFRSRGARMAELEMSFKYSFKQLMSAKLLLAALFNAACNAVLSLLLSGSNLGLDPVRLTFSWFAPFLSVSAVSLFIVIEVRDIYASLGCLGLWPALAVIISLNPDWLNFLVFQIKTELYAAISFVSCLILILDIAFLLSRSIERGDLFDTGTKKHIKEV